MQACDNLMGIETTWIIMLKSGLPRSSRTWTKQGFLACQHMGNMF